VSINVLTLMTDYLLFTQWLIKREEVRVNGLRHSK
jgi:hypothetical protein